MKSIDANAAIIALFGISLAIVPAIAYDAFTPVMSFPASPATMPGRAIDVLQLVPGMTVDEMNAALTEMGLVGDIEAPETSYRVNERGVTVQTTPFVAHVSATTQQGSFTVDFAGPAAGNQAVEFTREVGYADVLTAQILIPSSRHSMPNTAPLR
ncbi:hypothetical protein ABIB57_001941 [Devosia sp. UYZn731]|uniref:hypothetical protein n=1 Tax=Devosia sp. UYZn731 TaxID=3156345 RepID=UPI00339079EC